MKGIIDILEEIRPEFDFTKEKNFIDNGMLDSFDIISLVADLDKSFSISILGTDIIPENFNNLNDIALLLEKYGINKDEI